jgi:hypothetical protein
MTVVTQDTAVQTTDVTSGAKNRMAAVQVTVYMTVLLVLCISGAAGICLKDLKATNKRGY